MRHESPKPGSQNAPTSNGQHQTPSHHPHGPGSGADRPFLAPSTPETSRPYSSSPSGVIRPVTASVPQVSSVHFQVLPELPEIQTRVAEREWQARGFTHVTVPWTEMHWTTDNWKTSHVLRSSDVPCPVMNGYYFLPNVPAGVEVEFAIHAGIACHAPQDTAGSRDTADVWFNNDGKNYRQTTR
jgi:hypothetical protein